jgi:hypothetical protein
VAHSLATRRAIVAKHSLKRLRTLRHGKCSGQCLALGSDCHHVETGERPKHCRGSRILTLWCYDDDAEPHPNVFDNTHMFIELCLKFKVQGREVVGDKRNIGGACSRCLFDAVRNILLWTRSSSDRLPRATSSRFIQLDAARACAMLR